MCMCTTSAAQLTFKSQRSLNQTRRQRQKLRIGQKLLIPTRVWKTSEEVCRSKDTKTSTILNSPAHVLCTVQLPCEKHKTLILLSSFAYLDSVCDWVFTWSTGSQMTSFLNQSRAQTNLSLLKVEVGSLFLVSSGRNPIITLQLFVIQVVWKNSNFFTPPWLCIQTVTGYFRPITGHVFLLAARLRWMNVHVP